MIGKLTMALKRTLRRANHAGFFIWGEGSWSLRRHEQVVVDATTEQLPADIRKLVTAQLAQDFFVERTSNRINVIRFYEQDGKLRIPDPGFADRLTKVQLQVDGRKQNAHVTFYKGYIFSVEFKKPGKFYADKQITVCGVSQGKASESYTRSIDRLAHGRSEEDEQ